MAINFSTAVYLPCQETFGRPITVVPLASRPGTKPYVSRGHYDTRAVEVLTGDGPLADQETVLYIREVEFEVVPAQRDQIYLSAFAGLPEVGLFEVTNAITNGGGETTLTVRKIMRPSPEQIAMLTVYAGPAPKAFDEKWPRPKKSRGCAPW